MVEDALGLEGIVRGLGEESQREHKETQEAIGLLSLL